MAFIQYYQNNFSLSIKKVTPETTNLIIPLNADSIFLLKSNNQYDIYRIRSNQIVGNGSLPKDFVASQYVKPIVNFKQDCLFFFNNEANICKLNYKQNIIEIHQNVLPEKIKTFSNVAIEYRILDQFGLYLVGWIKNIQNMSCSFFVYEWDSKCFSNTIHLGSSFFNLKISNFSQKINLLHQKMQLKVPEINFVVVAEQDKKICYNYLQLNINQIVTQSQDSHIKDKKRFQLALKQSGKRTVNLSDQIAIFSYLIYPNIYVVCNRKQGPIMYEINMESNSNRKIQITTNIQKQKGIIRKFLGIVDGNMLFTIHCIFAQTLQIYSISVNNIQNIQGNTSKIIANKLLFIQNQGDLISKTKIANVQKSIDGYSLIKYQYEFQKITKLLIKQNSQYQPKLQVQVIYRIPKKYLYSQMAENLQFSSKMIYEILQLL